MIGRLRGTLIEKLPPQILIEIGGIGYEVQMPMSCIYELPNIGEEAINGNEVIKKTGELLRAASATGDFNFYGNVEGNDIFKGTVDIANCLFSIQNFFAA